MTPSQLLLEGVELMLFGIGFVFAAIQAAIHQHRARRG